MERVQQFSDATSKDVRRNARCIRCEPDENIPATELVRTEVYVHQGLMQRVSSIDGHKHTHKHCNSCGFAGSMTVCQQRLVLWVRHTTMHTHTQTHTHTHTHRDSPTPGKALNCLLVLCEQNVKVRRTHTTHTHTHTHTQSSHYVGSAG